MLYRYLTLIILIINHEMVCELNMTLIIALKWIIDNKEAVVVSSDSRVTVGGLVSYEARKVHPVVLYVNGEEVPLAIAAGAGDASLVKQGYRICESVLKKFAIEEWGRKTPSFEQFEEASKHIEHIFIHRFRELRKQGLEIDFVMILASVDISGKASIYVFDKRGLAEPMHENPGFAIIGKGFFTGGNILLRLLGYSPEKSYMLDLGVLTTFIIDVVSEIDPTVGPFVGESYLMRVKNKKVALGPLKEEHIKEYKEKVKHRKDIISRIWKLLDIVGEQKILEKIEELEKETSVKRA